MCRLGAVAYWVLKAVLTPILRFFFRVRVEGMERVSDPGPAIVGTREAQPIGQVVPKLFMPITIRISRPMRFERYTGGHDDPRALRASTDEVMFELRALSGQEYVDRYAKRKDVADVTDEAKI